MHYKQLGVHKGFAFLSKNCASVTRLDPHPQVHDEVEAAEMSTGKKVLTEKELQALAEYVYSQAAGKDGR